MVSTKWFAKVRVASALLVLVAGAGCVPDVAWLPDSSGFIYTTTDWPGGPPEMPKAQNGRLMHYDLSKKASRLIASTETKTVRPGLSPDGKRIAVARLGEKKDQSPTLQVVVYDLQGKEVQRSKVFDWGKKPEGDILYPHVFWAPKGNKVLIHSNKVTGICDLDNDEAVLLGTALPSIFGTTPIRPDGKGFLIARENNQLTFVDWAGNQSAVKIPVDNLTAHQRSILPIPSVVCWGRWDGDVAIATWKVGQLRIDTAKLIGTWHQPDETDWAFDGKEIQELYSFSDGKTKIVAVYLMSFRDFRDAGLPTVRVDLIGPKPNQRRVLVEKTPHCGIYPSPDKKLVALRYADLERKSGDRHRDEILVVNHNGDVVTEIDAGK